MKCSQKGVVGVRIEYANIGQTAQWSKTRYSWTLIVKNYNLTEKYEVVLEASLLTRHKGITVNSETVYDAIWKLPNFDAQFKIDHEYKGRIIEDGSEFVLFVNGKAFNEIYDSSYGYQPVNIVTSNITQIPETKAQVKKPYLQTNPTSTSTASKKLIWESKPPQQIPVRIEAPIYVKSQAPQSVFDQMKSLKKKQLEILMQSKKKAMLQKYKGQQK